MIDFDERYSSTGRFGLHWGEDAPDLTERVPEHAAAFATVLRRYAKLISGGAIVEDMAAELLPIVQIAARRT